MRMDLKGIILGIKASIIATTCCSIPLALALAFSVIGAGSMTAALNIPKYKLFFISVGTLSLLLSLYFTIKKRCNGVCSVNEINANTGLILVSVATYLALTLLLIYLILPALSEILFSLA